MMHGGYAIQVARAAACGAVALAAVGAVAIARADDPGLRSDLATVARRTVFFGHQSVGVNILDGIQRLAGREGVPLHVKEVALASGLPSGTLAHGFMSENGDPLRKLESFHRALGSGVDLAILKFCFVDVTTDTNVTDLFTRYQEAIRQLRSRLPGTTFVHVTIPLTGVQGGFKGWVKRVLGRSPYGLAENARREEYNALLRAAYLGKEPVFDLARVESTTPEGRVETAEWKGRAVPALVPDYTDDGGHLNDAGQLRAARELLSVLAAAPVQPEPAMPAAR
jgi:hypothetical protein